MKSALLAAALLFLAGCSEPSVTTTNPPIPGGIAGMWVSPAPNTRYIYKTIAFDTTQSSHVVKIDTLYFTSRSAIDGKPNVERFDYLSSLPQSEYVALEDNHDISFGQSANDKIYWTRYPTTAGSYTLDSTRDSVDDLGNRHTTFRNRTFLGTETIALPTGNALAYKVEDSLFGAFNGIDTFIYVERWWYVPSIGTYARMTEFVYSAGPDNSPNGLSIYRRDLIDYKP